MKKLLPILVLAAISAAHAADYSFVTTSFGTDGATLASTPVESSTDSAIALYKAMQVKAVKGEKFVGVVVEGEKVGLTCQEPGRGIHTITGKCSFTGLVDSSDFQPPLEFKHDLVVGGKLADLFKANIKMTGITRVGGLALKAGNLICATSSARFGRLPKCTFKSVTSTGDTLENLVGDGTLPDAIAKKLIEELLP